MVFGDEPGIATEEPLRFAPGDRLVSTPGLLLGIVFPSPWGQLECDDDNTGCLDYMT